MASAGNGYQHINIGGVGNKIQLGNHYGTGGLSNDTQDIAEHSQTNRTRDEELARRNALLRWLQFPRMDTRRKNIKPAHEKTFQWILNDEKEEGPTSTGFSKWLKTGTGVYWISGKAGSGKSTLMKSIQADNRTATALQKWSGGKPVFCPSFYFWYLGTEMQQSTLGLLRSLLWQILNRFPDRINSVFPEWDRKDALMEPMTEELVDALHSALTCGHSDTHMCFFVDGLDEYKGNTIDLASLAESLMALGDLPMVKLVLSSRPLETLREKFSLKKHLKLQDLTRPDIDRFVADRLCKNTVFLQMQTDHPQEIQKLLHELAERAEGVFLWVHIVVLNLLDGLTHRDEPSKLMERLSQLPKELSDLFLRMLENIPTEYQRDAYRLLRLSLTWVLDRRYRVGPRALTLHLALQYKQIRPEQYTVASEAKSDMRRWLKNTFAIINTRCLGLLEVSDFTPSNIESCALDESPKVQFLHRSVVDFLNEKDILARLTKVGKTNFDVNVATASALAMLFKAKIEQGSDSGMATKLVKTEKQLAKFMHYSRLAEISNGQPQTAIMDSVNLDMSSRRPDADNWPDQYLFHSASRLDPEKTWEYDFLGLAIASGCSLYALEKLESISGLEARTGRPFLLYAISPYPTTSDLMHGINPDIVKYLLEERDADPNKRLLRTTVWQLMLRHMKKKDFALQTRTDSNRIAEPAYHDQVLDAVDAMLRHGADCNASNTGGSRESKSSTLDVIKRLRKQPCPCQYQMEVLGTKREIRGCKCNHAKRLSEKIDGLVKFVEERRHSGGGEGQQQNRSGKKSGRSSSAPKRSARSKHGRNMTKRPARSCEMRIFEHNCNMPDVSQGFWSL